MNVIVKAPLQCYSGPMNAIVKASLQEPAHDVGQQDYACRGLCWSQRVTYIALLVPIANLGSPDSDSVK